MGSGSGARPVRYGPPQGTLVPKVHETAKLKSMMAHSNESDERANYAFAPDRPRWRARLAWIAIFVLVLALLMTAFSFFGTIVDQFFITLYVE